MNVYEIITERILQEMEKGTTPWMRPWKNKHGEEPTNLISKKPYRGVNRFLLSCIGHERPYFLTYNQARAIGGQVRKGEHGVPVIFWQCGNRMVEDGNGGETEQRSFVLRYYTVFNVAQVNGIADKIPVLPPVEPTQWDTSDRGEAIVAAWKDKPQINHVPSSRAFYNQALDSVTLPERSQFSSAEGYYETLFHECVHATGHKSRLNRKTLTDAAYFGSPTYCREELVAEIGAAFVLSAAGLENPGTLANNAAYVRSWAELLRTDTKAIVVASAQAQKAADYILNKAR